MVQRIEKEEQLKESEDSKIPVVPNYLDLILGEVHAVRVLLEKQSK